MSKFIINTHAQSNGDYEVHNLTKGCCHMPNTENQRELGEHNSCHDAVNFAKKIWPDAKINGCYYCCQPCHTT